MTALAFTVAAVLGTLGRWQLAERLPRPIGTLAANLAGAFALGWLSGASETTRTIAGIAALGSLTTFSTLMVEILDLWGRQRKMALVYGVATFVGGIALAWMGLQLA